MSYTPTVWKTGDIVSSTKLNKIETELVALDTDKANIDGYYESMTVGNAEQIVATVGVEDSVPFNFRTTGGSADVGDRKTMEVVGGTVAWNQLFDFSENSDKWLSNGSVRRTWSDGVLTVDNGITSSAYPYQLLSEIAGHKYLYCAKGKTIFGTGVSDRAAISIYASGASTDITAFFGATDTAVSGMWAATKDYNNRMQIRPNNPLNAVVIYYFTVFDLTQMFGSTIADYIYSLEQANAGAGVAWFRKLFPKPYYAYNAGELMSVKTSAYKSTGFNQWDEESESGYWDVATGEKESSTNWERCSNYIPVVPNTSYYLKATIPASGSFGGVLFYDANKNYISYQRTSSVNNTWTTPSNCHFITFYANPNYFTNPICINLHWDGERDGEYEPYEAHTYALDSDLELRGIPKLDADNQLYYDGDIYEADGDVTRKYWVVDMGELAWAKFDTTPGNYWFRATLPLEAKDVASTARPNMLCSPYATETPNNVYIGVQGISKTGTYNYVIVCDMSYSDAATFKAAMSGVYLVYELATPTEETADPFQTPQIVNDFGTEEFVDTRTIPIPVGHNSKYQANLRAKLEMAPNSPSGDGDYIVRQASGQNTYVPITFPADELPAAPTTDGNYVLKCTVSSGTATFTWEAQT